MKSIKHGFLCLRVENNLKDPLNQNSVEICDAFSSHRFWMTDSHDGWGWQGRLNPSGPSLLHPVVTPRAECPGPYPCTILRSPKRTSQHLWTTCANAQSDIHLHFSCFCSFSSMTAASKHFGGKQWCRCEWYTETYSHHGAPSNW